MYKILFWDVFFYVISDFLFFMLCFYVLFFLFAFYSWWWGFLVDGWWLEGFGLGWLVYFRIYIYVMVNLILSLYPFPSILVQFLPTFQISDHKIQIFSLSTNHPLGVLIFILTCFLCWGLYMVPAKKILKRLTNNWILEMGPPNTKCW